MEWVETTGRTIEEAKDLALDRLGVAEDEAEFEVIDEPKTGLFGRLRIEARIRARVKPRRPRPKLERRERRRGGRGRTRPSGVDRGDRKESGEDTKSGPRRNKGSGAQRSHGERQGSGSARSAAPGRQKRSRTAGKAVGPPEKEPGKGSRREEDSGMGEESLTLQEQAEVVSEFLDGLLEAFEIDGEIGIRDAADGDLEVTVVGDRLGLLIGPGGSTMQAIQELARTTVQRQGGTTREGRVFIDIGEYRARRRDSLAEFVREMAQEVIETGTEISLETMGPADRKTVHDTVNDIDGVATVSEGQDPRRRVVLVPENDHG